MTGGDGAATFRTSAEAYDKHVGRYGPALAAALIGATGIRKGARALDVGCGPGALTAALAELLGPGEVVAVDPSEPYANACRSRVPQADVRVGPAEDLPFADDAFDAALAQLVVNFMDDAPRGVGEMARVVRPGGSVAAAVWDYGGEMKLLRSFWDAAQNLELPAAAEHDEGRIMRYCRPNELAELLEGAGLADVETEALEVEAEYENFDRLWEPFEQGVAPSGAFASALSPADRERLRTEFHLLLGAPEGRFELSARAWCAVGRKRS